MPEAIAPAVLICITHSFPFDIGDEHFEDELKVLSERGMEVIVVPRSAVKEQTRLLPQQVKILWIPFRLSLVAKWKALLQLDWKVLRGEFNFVRKNFSRWPALALLRNMFGSLLIATDLCSKLRPVVDRYASQGYTVHLYSYWNDLSAVALALLKSRFPVVNACSRAHAFEIYDERHAGNYIPFQQIKFDKLNRIFFISSFGLNYIRQRFPALHFDNCRLARLGCFEMPGAPYTKHASCIRIMSIGYNYSVKRIELLAESLTAVTGLEVQWKHVGTAMHDRSRYEKRVRELLSVNSTVQLQFTGNLNHQQLAELYASTSFDLLLNLSALEGVPVSMMECMSAGIPVMATAVGGVPEIVKDGFNGVLLPANPSPREVAAALEKFHAKSEAEIMSFRKHAHDTWQQQYNAAINYPVFAKELMPAVNA